MPKLYKPSSTKVIVTPKDGEIEITLNINISVDGSVTATTDNGSVSVKDQEEKVELMVPDFLSGMKLDFGK